MCQIPLNYISLLQCLSHTSSQSKQSPCSWHSLLLNSKVTSEVNEVFPSDDVVGKPDCHCCAVSNLHTSTPSQDGFHSQIIDWTYKLVHLYCVLKSCPFTSQQVIRAGTPRRLQGFQKWDPGSSRKHADTKISPQHALCKKFSYLISVAELHTNTTYKTKHVCFSQHRAPQNPRSQSSWPLRLKTLKIQGEREAQEKGIYGAYGSIT